LTKRKPGDKIIFEDLNIMKYKNIGIGLIVVTGILIWEIISIVKTKPESIISSPEVVPGGAQQQSGDVSVEINYLAGKSDASKIVFEVSLNTHSVDLNDIDFQKTVLMQKDGLTIFPLKVETSGADHHRSAELSFSQVGVPLKIVFVGTEAIGRKEFEFKELE